MSGSTDLTDSGVFVFGPNMSEESNSCDGLEQASKRLCSAEALPDMELVSKGGTRYGCFSLEHWIAVKGTIFQTTYAETKRVG